MTTNINDTELDERPFTDGNNHDSYDSDEPVPFTESNNWRKLLWKMRDAAVTATNAVTERDSDRSVDSGSADNGSGTANDDTTNNQHLNPAKHAVGSVVKEIKDGIYCISEAVLAAVFTNLADRCSVEDVSTAFESMLTAIPRMTDTGIIDTSKVPTKIKLGEIETGVFEPDLLNDLRAVALGAITAVVMNQAVSELEDRCERYLATIQDIYDTKLDPKSWNETIETLIDQLNTADGDETRLDISYGF